MTPPVISLIGAAAAMGAGHLAAQLDPVLGIPVTCVVAFFVGCLYKDAVLRPHIIMLRDGLRELQATMAAAVRAAKAGR